MTEADSESIIDLLVQQEERISEFYRACAEEFPEWRSQWLLLAVAEERHANILRGIQSDPDEGAAFVSRRRLALNPLRIMLEFIDKGTAALQDSDSTLITALSCARDIENSILEKKVMEPVAGDSAATREMIEQIRAETAQHRLLVAGAISGLMK